MFEEFWCGDIRPTFFIVKKYEEFDFDAKIWVAIKLAIINVL